MLKKIHSRYQGIQFFLRTFDKNLASCSKKTYVDKKKSDKCDVFVLLLICMSQFFSGYQHFDIFLNYNTTSTQRSTFPSRNTTTGRCAQQSNYSYCPQEAWMRPDIHSTERENSKPARIRTRVSCICRCIVFSQKFDLTT